MAGYIKLHREMRSWEWFTDFKTSHLFTYILLNASYNEYLWRGEVFKAGEMPFGLNKASMETGLSIQNIRTSLKRLESTREITTKKSNKGTVITVINWDKYQGNEEQVTSNQQASNKQSTTTKKEKKEKKVKKESLAPVFSEVVDHLNKITGRNYKSSTKTIQNLIKSRLNDGATLEDFKTVINTKSEEWLNDSRMNKYLRPSTLFGSKFSEYSQEQSGQEVKKKAEDKLEAIFN